MGNFEELKVWHRSKDLAVSIYKTTGKGAFVKDYCLKDQIRKSAVSVPSNIAEGDELGTNKQSIRCFYIAKGSVAELLNQTIIAHEIGYLTQPQFDEIKEECQAISAMLTKLIQARSKK
jgi:four helix bundle protein